MHFAINVAATSFFNDAHPIEICAVSVSDERICFCERIKPTRAIDSAAFAHHRISADLLAHCFSEDVVLWNFLVFLAKYGARKLVAHFSIRYSTILNLALKRSSLSPLDVRWECTREMSIAKFPKFLGEVNLVLCCRLAGITNIETHRAFLCARLYKFFFQPTPEDLANDAGLALVNAKEAATALGKDFSSDTTVFVATPLQRRSGTGGGAETREVMRE